MREPELICDWERECMTTMNPWSAWLLAVLAPPIKKGNFNVEVARDDFTAVWAGSPSP